MNFRLLRSILAAGCVIVALSACVYRMDIPQGNRIDAKTLEQLKIGMSRNQVKFLLGSPAVVDTYRPDQWHYVYFHKYGSNQKIEKKRMTLHFKDDLLFGIDGSVTPPT